MSDQSALDLLASHGVTRLLSSHGQVRTLFILSSLHFGHGSFSLIALFVSYFFGPSHQRPLSSLENQSICILFSANWCRPCRTFIPQLAQLYETVNAAGEHPLEILFVSLDHDEDAFNEHFRCMPWLAVPFDVSLHGRLNKHYRVHRIPSLIPLTSEEIPGRDELIGSVEDYGAEAFPFTKKRLEELKILDVSRREDGNLEHLLAGEGRDHLFLSDGGAGRVCLMVDRCNSFCCTRWFYCISNASLLFSAADIPSHWEDDRALLRGQLESPVL